MTGEVHLDTAGGVFGGERREIAEKCSKHGLATTCGQPMSVASAGKSKRTNE